ncbi:MAG TPA: hypothetical protein VKE69_01495, partial [Planctomycetota bacterium]|nr:hypothetical protein [Planctomycetota bacterium]
MSRAKTAGVVAVAIALLAFGYACKRAAPAPPAAPARSEPPDTLSATPEHARLWDGDPTNLVPRWAEKLETGSRDGVAFAIDRLGAAGDRAVPEILRVLERNRHDPARAGAVLNALDALSRTGTRRDDAIDLVLAILAESPGTVRQAAARTLGVL